MKNIKLTFVFALILMIFCSCGAKPVSDDTTFTLNETILQTEATQSETLQTSETSVQDITTTKDETTEVQTTVSTTTAPASSTTTQSTTANTTTTKPTTTKKVVTTSKASKPTKPHTTTKAVTSTTLPQTTTKKAAAPSTTKHKTTKPTTTKDNTEPMQPENTTGYCYITIDMRNVKNNPDLLKSEKRAFVASDGYILKRAKVEVKTDETAFDILKKACKENICRDKCKYCKNGIALETTFTPAFGSYYVEGIHQIYEKDCGSMSGWMFCVNGVYPEVSSSAYDVHPGDEIIFAYTCDMGEDLGQSY